MKFLSRLLILTGITFITIALFFVYQRHNPMRLSFAYDNSFVNSNVNHEVIPSRLVIQTIGVDLPIVPSEIKNKKWSDTKTGVSYLSSSPLPGEEGNSVIYGHNWQGLLGSLPSVTPGDIISIVYSDGSTKDFEIEFTTTVDPSQTGVLASSKQKRLTVYTCTGFLDSKRFVATAFLVDKQSE